MTEIHEDDSRHSLGVVKNEHWRTWGNGRCAHVHSLTLYHSVRWGKQPLRTVLVWRRGRWHNNLHRNARYTVSTPTRL